MSNFDYKKYLAEGRLLKENIADFLNVNYEEIVSKLGNPGSDFEIIGDDKVATAGDGDKGIDISFDKNHMNKLFPEDDPYNEVEELTIAGKVVYYNDYLAEGRLLKEYETSKWYVIYRLRDPENDVNKFNFNEKPPHNWETISGEFWDADKYGEGRDRAKARAAAYTRGDEKLEDFQLALDAEANRIPQEDDAYQFDTERKEESWSMEESVLKENITITGEYEGEPVINSGDELEEYLIDIMPQAIGAKDFARKVAFGLTDETSSLSLEDQRKLIQFYLDNKQYFGSQGKSSPLPSSDYEKVVDGLRARKIPSRVKLEDSGRINIELGFDFPDSLAEKVFNMLDELGVDAEIMAETTVKGIKSERINGGPRRDYRREDRDDGSGQDEEWYA